MSSRSREDPGLSDRFIPIMGCALQTLPVLDGFSAAMPGRSVTPAPTASPWTRILRAGPQCTRKSVPKLAQQCAWRHLGCLDTVGKTCPVQRIAGHEPPMGGPGHCCRCDMRAPAVPETRAICTSFLTGTCAAAAHESGECHRRSLGVTFSRWTPLPLRLSSHAPLRTLV